MLFNGKVTRKSIEDGRHLVAIEHAAKNQDGTRSVVGAAVVELLSRAGRRENSRVAVSELSRGCYQRGGVP